jgi:hypothetical protein
MLSKSKINPNLKIRRVHLVNGAKTTWSEYQKGAKPPKEPTGKVWTQAKFVWHDLTTLLSRGEQWDNQELASANLPTYGISACWGLVLKCYELRTRQHKRRLNDKCPSSFEALFPFGYNNLRTKVMKDIPSSLRYMIVKMRNTWNTKDSMNIYISLLAHFYFINTEK